MKKLTSLLLTLVIISGMLVTPVMADNTVKVTIAPYNVILNGIYFDSQYAEYPMIMYNDITYIPMTYGNARFMGIATEFDEKNRTFEMWQISEYTQNPEITKTLLENDNEYYTAVIPDYRIIINKNKVIKDNNKKKYPILNFRDITYFPLTWEYIVDDFGWYYTFSQYAGLNIKRNSSKNYSNVKYETGIKVYYEGEKVLPDSKDGAIAIDGEVLIPHTKNTLTKLGFVEEWMDVWNDERSISMSGGDSGSKFFEDEKIAVKFWSTGDHIVYKTAAPTVKINGVFYVSLKSLCEIWHYEVNYDKANKKAVVTYGLTPRNLTAEEAREKLENRLGDLGTWYAGEKNVLVCDGVYNCVDNKKYYQFRLRGRVLDNYTTLTWYVVAVDGTDMFEGQCINYYLDSWRPLM